MTRPTRSWWHTSPLVVIAALWAAEARAIDPVQEAIAFLRQAPKTTRRALCNAPKSRPALVALGEILERGRIPRRLLMDVVANPNVLPYLGDTIRAVGRIDDLPGTRSVLELMAVSKHGNQHRGAAAELVAAASTRSLGLTSLNGNVTGLQTDLAFADGTLAEVKSVGYVKSDGHPHPAHTDVVGKVIDRAARQIIRRCGGKRPAMIVIPDGVSLRPHEHRLRRIAAQMGTDFSVLAFDPDRLTARRVYRHRGAPDAVARMNRRSASRDRKRQRD